MIGTWRTRTAQGQTSKRPRNATGELGHLTMLTASSLLIVTGSLNSIPKFDVKNYFSRLLMRIHSSFKLLNPYRSVLILTRDLHPQAVGHRHLTAIFIFITASLSWPSTYITPSSQTQAPDSGLYHRDLILTRDLHPQAVRHRHLAAICSLSQCPYPDQGPTSSSVLLYVHRDHTD